MNLPTLDFQVALLHSIVTNRDASNFLKLLQAEFVYPEVISSSTNKVYGNNNSLHTIPNVRRLMVMTAIPIMSMNRTPFALLIEALFVDYENQFHQRDRCVSRLEKLVSKLVTLNNADLCTAFICGLKGSDISADILFSCNDHSIRAIENALSLMKKYALELKKQHIAKGQATLKLVDDLTAKIASFKEINKQNVVYSPQQKLQILGMKFAFARELHREDEALGEHRGWKRCITNLFTLLFTAGIANIFNKALTGHWLFFDKTKSEEKIAEVDQALQCSFSFN